MSACLGRIDLARTYADARLTAVLLLEKVVARGSFSDVSAACAFEIAQAFAARQEAVDLLPNIAQYHVFNQKIIESYRRQALIIIEEIESLLDEIKN